LTYIVARGSHCPFADIVEYDPSVPLNRLIPPAVDVVHLNHTVNELPNKPYVITMHGNLNQQHPLDINTVFVSANHAARFGSRCFVHNGIDPDDYGVPALNNMRRYIHFLGDAAWRIKNVRGAIGLARKAGVPLHILGGHRFNFNMGIRLTLDPNTRFHGMVGGAAKNKLLNGSKALLFPVLWHEPFGLAIVESLYFGCPVIGTPYGSLPELVPQSVGFLSDKKADLVYFLKHLDGFNRSDCHEHVMEHFTSKKMAASYVLLYEKVLNGYALNDRSPVLLEIQHAKFLPFN
jgi:glycosyltransferase involved in cell wall biosynthesis